MYKIGDKVKIRTWKSMEKEFGLTSTGYINCNALFTELMHGFCGEIFTINKIEEDNRFRLKGNSWQFSTDMFVKSFPKGRYKRNESKMRNLQ